VPPRMMRPTTIASPSFFTVAPKGSFVFSMRTIWNKSQFWKLRFDSWTDMNREADLVLI
jgi:hypothetical protein